MPSASFQHRPTRENNTCIPILTRDKFGPVSPHFEFNMNRALENAEVVCELERCVELSMIQRHAWPTAFEVTVRNMLENQVRSFLNFEDRFNRNGGFPMQQRHQNRSTTSKNMSRGMEKKMKSMQRAEFCANFGPSIICPSICYQKASSHILASIRNKF